LLVFRSSNLPLLCLGKPYINVVFHVMFMAIRQPIIAIMGHVDHGKTLILDSIRGSAVAAREAGGITQAIGASIINIDTIKKICGPLLEGLKTALTIPGLLFIDTPGHAAFVNLRKRGGNLADIAVLVVDINEGVKPQTKESIEILKKYRTPFVVAANKIDLIRGWSSRPGSIIKNVSQQSPDVQRIFETKLYELVGQLSEFGINADRFDRVSDYTKQVAVVPTSAKTSEGIPELLMVLTGLAQRFLEDSLKIDVKGPAKGTILEVKEQTGLGKVLDVIIYDGSLSVNDKIVIGTLAEPVVTKVKALLEVLPLSEMREKKSRFKHVRRVKAATGVRIVAPGVDEVLSGMPLMEASDETVEKVKDIVKSEVGEVLIDTDAEGVVVKADSLGSLEALIGLLKEHGVPIRKASIGLISKKDFSDAEAMGLKNPVFGVILGFNVPCPESPPVKVIASDVIYKIIEEYDVWKDQVLKKIELSELEKLTKPCKIELLKGYVFRQSNPAVLGVEVLSGTLKTKTPLMNKQGKQLTFVKSIQREQESVSEAKKGSQVAVSLPGVVVGRQVHEGDVLYSFLTEEEFRKYKEFKNLLSADEKSVLKEIAEIMRQADILWGV